MKGVIFKVENNLKNIVLSVIVPSYNAAKYLEKNIPTMVSRERVRNRIEVLIVNDGSKDNTREIGEQLVEAFPGTVRLINKLNGGHGSTINVGVRDAHGDFIKVVDADDEVDLDAFEALIDLIETIKDDIQILVSPYIEVNMETGDETVKDESNISTDEMLSYDELLEKSGKIPAMHSICYRKDILVENNIFLSENCFYVDIQYNVFPIPYIQKAVYFNKPVYRYYVGNPNQSVSARNFLKNKDMHFKVLSSIIDFVNQKKMLLTITQQDYINRLISELSATYLNILLSIKDKKMCRIEVDKFLVYLKQNHPYSYTHPFGVKMKLIIKSPIWISAMSYFYRKKVGL